MIFLLSGYPLYATVQCEISYFPYPLIQPITIQRGFQHCQSVLSLVEIFAEGQNCLNISKSRISHRYNIYRTHAIITRGLYILKPLFEGQKHLFKFFRQFWPYVRLVMDNLLRSPWISVEEGFINKSGL